LTESFKQVERIDCGLSFFLIEPMTMAIKMETGLLTHRGLLTRLRQADDHAGSLEF
jgi:hypothetical protein